MTLSTSKRGNNVVLQMQRSQKISGQRQSLELLRIGVEREYTNDQEENPLEDNAPETWDALVPSGRTGDWNREQGIIQLMDLRKELTTVATAYAATLGDIEHGLANSVFEAFYREVGGKGFKSYDGDVETQLAFQNGKTSAVTNAGQLAVLRDRTPDTKREALKFKNDSGEWMRIDRFDQNRFAISLTTRDGFQLQVSFTVPEPATITQPEAPMVRVTREALYAPIKLLEEKYKS